MSGPLLILAVGLLVVGYSLVYTGLSLGTSWETSFQSALLGGIKLATPAPTASTPLGTSSVGVGGGLVA